MRIGLDFDNTIVSYDELFHKVAVEQGAVPPETPVNKVAVRDYLRRADREDEWTAMQGYVYGARMDEAIAYSGLNAALREAVNAGHELHIVSHKTQHPFMGPQYDLHAAARGWIDQYLAGDIALVDPANIYFELTKVEKIARIAALECDVFVDDLPEILLADGFLPNTARVLFDPEVNHVHGAVAALHRLSCWQEFPDLLARLADRSR